MQDFGECLVDIRNRLEIRLPVRVRPWRIFFIALLEGFGLPFVHIVQRDFRSVTTIGYGLANPEVDMREVMQEFEFLKTISGTSVQMEQARQTFEEQVLRRTSRLNHELTLWSKAIQAGTFLGSILFLLPIISIFMCTITNHDKAIPLIGGGFFLVGIIVAIICAKHWHR